MSKCPSCGYCEHCGRKNTPSVNPWVTGPRWINPQPFTSPFASPNTYTPQKYPPYGTYTNFC